MSNPVARPLAQGIHADLILAPVGASSPSVDALAPPQWIDVADGAVAAAARRLVLKIVVAQKNGVSQARRPHDVVREVRVLEKARHSNIVPLLSYEFNAALLEHTLTFPLLALTLSDLLASEVACTHVVDLFAYTAKGVFAALQHLHSLGLAHRDINPANIMVDWHSVPRLIDFGTAWDPNRRGDDGHGGMSCAVGAGPYRAPELLFSPPTYDAQAVDLWGAGVSLAEFFRPRGTRASSVSDFGGSDTSDSPDPSQFEPPDLTGLQLTQPPAVLFSSQFGELGLAASIFRLLGTPTHDSWPSFSSLPDAGKMPFDVQPARLLRDALELDNSVGTSSAGTAIVDCLEALVRLEPAARRSATETLRVLECVAQNEVAGVLQPLLEATATQYRV